MPRRSRREAAAKRGGLRRTWRQRIPWIPIAAALALLVVGYFIVDSFGLINPVGERYGQLPRTHIAEGEKGSYNSIPPTSGAHSGAARWGISSRTIADESAVHNLEHGGIVIAYHEISAGDLTSLQSFIRSYPRNRQGNVKIVLHPYDRIPAGNIVVTAWGWLDRLTSFDERRIRAFVDAHIGRCCENVD